ncbi:MAG TPA: SdrD B-like domain-containing protein [Bacteroidia bacterium]|nr:SdrD B-like domain-containing protein [Bacteroidia bacterium]
MKKLVAVLVFVMLCKASLAQTLTSVSPDSTYRGATLSALISGVNTLFQSSSTTGFYLEQGTNSIIGSLSSMNALSETQTEIDFVIPYNAPYGWYDLRYVYEDTASQGTYLTLTLPNAVEILSANVTISGVVFEDLNGNGIQDAGEQGVSGQQILLTPDNTLFTTNSNGAYMVNTYPGIKTITWQQSSGFVITAGSQASYTANFTAPVTGYNFGLSTTGPVIISISADSMLQGTTLNAVISCAGVVLQNGSPLGAIISTYLTTPGGTPVVGGSNITVINPTQFSVTFNSSGNLLAPGVYSLVLYYSDSLGVIHTLTLPNAVIVYAASMYLSGTAFVDVNPDGLLGFQEPGMGGQTITLQPDNQTVQTDNLGNYTIPTSPGNKTITITPSTNTVVNPPGAATISGNYSVTTTGLNFPLNTTDQYLTSMSPFSALAGTGFSAYISGANTVFQSSSPPTGAIYDAYLFRTDTAVTYYANANTFNIIDDLHFYADFSIPANAPIGWYNLGVVYDLTGFGNYITLNLQNALYIDQGSLFLQGNVFYDANSNGIKDVGEPGFSGQKVIVQPDNVFAFTDNSGNYSVGSYAGTHTVQWQNTIPGFSLSSGSQSSYNVNASATTTGLDFGLNSTLPVYDCKVVSRVGLRRCLMNNATIVNYKNTGYVTYDARITMKFSSNQTFIAGSITPTSVNGQTVVYDFPGLTAQTTGSIIFQLGMPAAGSVVSDTIIMESLINGTVMETDTLISSKIVSCSFDPNDKSVTPAGILSNHYTLMGSQLDYLIRFQNTGNDTAYTVVVRDVIDTGLDLNTFALIDASHNVQTQVNLSNREVVFTFANIMLVDSNTNELLSHGFVRYSIMANQWLPNNTTVFNDAAIYFDQNDPIITNETFNTMVIGLPTSVAEIPASSQSMVRVIPNPFNSKADIVFDNENNQTYHLVVYNTEGKEILRSSTKMNRIGIERKNLAEGLYYFRLLPEGNAKSYSGKFIISN